MIQRSSLRVVQDGFFDPPSERRSLDEKSSNDDATSQRWRDSGRSANTLVTPSAFNSTAKLDDEDIEAQPASSTPSKDQEKDDSESQPDPADDWTGPDDPDNPQNWSTVKKAFHIMIPSLFSFAVTFGSSVYSPAIDGVMTYFDVSITVAILPLSLYVIGLAFGAMITAPISETYGRRMVYRSTMLVSMLFTLGAGFSNTIHGFIICRFFAGAFGSSSLSVGSGTMADLFLQSKRGPALITYMTSPFLGPAIGPIIGGFVAQYKDHRWTQWTILFVTLPIYLTSLFMSETYKKAILAHRAKSLPNRHNKPKPPSHGAKIKAIFTATLIRPVHMLCIEPIVGAFSLYCALLIALLFSFFEAFPLVFREVYGFTTSQNGLVFVGILIGVLSGSATLFIINFYVFRPKVKEAAKQNKSVAPEHRLYAAMIGSLGVTTGLFWFAWTARPNIHWIVPILATIPFGWGTLCIFVSAATYLVDVYGPLKGASAMAANSLLRYILGAAFPLFVLHIYEGLGIGWATSLLGFLSVAMLPIPWVLFKWGPQIRAKSTYDVIDA